GARAIVGGAAKIFWIGRVDEAHLDALIGECVREQIPGSSIEVGRTDDVVTDAGDVLNRESGSRLTGGQCQGSNTGFQRGEAFLEHVVGRVHDTRVDVAELLEREQILRMLSVAELI